MMKKLFIIFLLSYLNVNAQVLVGGTSPVPSVSNLPISVNSPPGISTGIPNISYPLISLPTLSKNLTLNLVLQYNPAVLKSDDTASETGLGWSLSGGNVVYREVVGDPDEYSNNLSDNYYFSIPKGSGKFKIIKNSSGNYEAIHLIPSTFRISFTGTPNTNYYDINSFSITDNDGLKYHFNIYGISPIRIGYPVSTLSYKSVFYIDKITTIDNKEIVKYYYDYHQTGTIPTTYIYKLKKIESKDYGTIEYSYNNSFSNNSDPYSIFNLTLKDSKGTVITQYDLMYNFIHHASYDGGLYQHIAKRILKNIIKKDKYSAILEKTTLDYDNDGTYTYYGSSEVPYLYDKRPLSYKDNSYDPKFETKGTLKSITFPAGGKIKYTFVPNELSTGVDRTSSSFEQTVQNGTAMNSEDLYYLQKIDSIAFDTKQLRTIPLNTNDKSVFFVKFFKEELYPTYDPEGPIPQNPPEPFLSFKIRKTNNNAIVTGSIVDQEADWISKMFNSPADINFKLELEGWGKGWFEVYILKAKNPPYYDAVAQNGKGIRINKIEYFAGKDDPNPIKTISYNYLKKDTPRTSSGSLTLDNGFSDTLFYKVVSIKSSDEEGETVHYFEAENFPDIPISSGTYKPYKNITNLPIPRKTEIYNALGQKKQEIIFSNVYGEVEPQYESQSTPNSTQKYYTKTAFIQRKVDTVNVLNNFGQYLRTISEINNNSHNFSPHTQKQILADGTHSETEYKYASEKGNTKLLGSNMFSVPLEVTQKQNGTEIGKIETSYDHADNYFPSSVKTYGVNGVTVNEDKNDLYDSMGNVLQSSSKTGQSTTYIYGYNGTLLIAKIAGAKYNDVMSALGQSSAPEAYKNLEIYTRSNQDTDDATEETLRQKLDEFRLTPLLKNYEITTYTYDPLIGMKSVTSPGGNKEYYYYDTANRLIRVEDANHNIIKENKYKQNLFD